VTKRSKLTIGRQVAFCWVFVQSQKAIFWCSFGQITRYNSLKGCKGYCVPFGRWGYISIFVNGEVCIIRNGIVKNQVPAQCDATLYGKFFSVCPFYWSYLDSGNLPHKRSQCFSSVSKKIPEHILLNLFDILIVMLDRVELANSHPVPRSLRIYPVSVFVTIVHKQPILPSLDACRTNMRTISDVCGIFHAVTRS